MAPAPFAGIHVLVVEDEFVIAEALKIALLDAGACVVGSAGNIEAALRMIETATCLDAAILDANLGGEMSLPVALRLEERGVRILLTTGYDGDALPASMATLPRCEKPSAPSSVLDQLRRLLPH